jgi:hypothetical protein
MEPGDPNSAAEHFSLQSSHLKGTSHAHFALARRNSDSPHYPDHAVALSIEIPRFPAGDFSALNAS